MTHRTDQEARRFRRQAAGLMVAAIIILYTFIFYGLSAFIGLRVRRSEGAEWARFKVLYTQQYYDGKIRIFEDSKSGRRYLWIDGGLTEITGE